MILFIINGIVNNLPKYMKIWFSIKVLNEYKKTDAAHLCFHQPFGTYMMPHSTVMPEPTTCVVGHVHPSIWRVIEWCQKLLSVLLSNKMPLVTHHLSVLNRDMFSSRSVYRTYAETSLLARRPLPSSYVELGGTSESITNISA